MSPQAAIPLPETFDESGFEELKAEIAAYVANEGEEWTRRIEAERAVPAELALRAEGARLISLARRTGRVRRHVASLLPLPGAAGALRDVARVAADDRPRRHGVWRSVDQFATEEHGATT